MTTTTANYLNDLRDQCHAMSTEKGFYDDYPQVGDKGWVEFDAMKLALIHSEVSEVLEELREGRDPVELYYSGKTCSGMGFTSPSPIGAEGELLKPEGLPAELADVLIRVLDYAGSRGIDLGEAFERKLAYNATRGRLHGKEF